MRHAIRPAWRDAIRGKLGGASKLDALLALFASAGSDVGVERTSGTGTHYLLHQALGNGYYWSIRLLNNTSPDGAALHTIETHRIMRLIALVNQDGAGVVYGGGGWTGNLSAGAAYGGNYRRTVTTNDSVTYTTPAGTTWVGAMHYVGSSGGLAKILIDGDPTLATSLPTAQSLVDAGTFPATILVANGGTLNPTDRVYDQFVNITSTKVEYANGLASGAHTVQVICTGYKRAAASDVRLYISAFWTNPAAGSTLSTAGVGTKHNTDLSTISSVWEYAYSYLSGAATNEGYHGNSHGYDHEQTFTIEVDGAVVNPSNYQISAGGLLAINRTSLLRHIDLGATNCASIALSYVMRPTTGLTIAHDLTWLVDGEVGQRIYPVMMTAEGLLDRGSAIGAGADYDLTLNDGDESNASGKFPAHYMWDEDGEYGVMTHIDAKSVDNWAHANSRGYIDDRTDYGINKIYYIRAEGSGTFSINDVWQSSANYRCQRFISGANAALAGKY